MDEIRRSYCGLCHPRCGILLHIKDDRNKMGVKS